MVEFSVRSTTFEGVTLEIQGSPDVKITGALFEDCVRAAITCATQSGCLASGQVHLTDSCAEALMKHHEATNCITHGFGVQVRPTADRLKSSY